LWTVGGGEELIGGDAELMEMADGRRRGYGY
jgi:hypothetical protein